MIRAEFNINNGIDAATCKIEGQTLWTYNQGVISEALVELNIAAPDPLYLGMGDCIAHQDTIKSYACTLLNRPYPQLAMFKWMPRWSRLEKLTIIPP